MALGLPPKYEGEIHLEPVDVARQFLALAVETAKELNWRLDFSDEKQVVFLNTNDKKWKTRITFKIEGRWAYVKSESTGGELFDWGKNKKSVGEFLGVFKTLKPSYTPEELDAKYEAMESAQADSAKGVPILPGANKITNFLYLFVPRGGYFVTPIIIDLNFLIFLLMVVTGTGFHPDPTAMVAWGANYKPLVMEGQWWRLLTNVFIHFGVAHVSMNMLVLIYIGLLLEPRIGRVRFAAAYILTGITASVSSLWWHTLTVSAGASGAIFGLFGVFLALVLTKVTEKEHRTTMLISIGVFVVYNLVHGLQKGIDDSAHLGGLISGLVIGFAFYPALLKPELKIRNALVEVSGFAGIAVAMALMLTHVSDPVGQYAKLKVQFGHYQNIALGFYQIPRPATEKQLLHAVDAEGIAYWKACERVLDKMDSIPDLPEHLVSRTALLREYCDNRLNSYRLIDRSIRQHTPKYKVRISLYNLKIQLLMTKYVGERVNDSLMDYKIGPGLFPKLPKGLLYVVDGHPELDSVKVHPDEIGSIRFLRPKTSYQIYGVRGKYGSYIIETKSDLRKMAQERRLYGKTAR